MTDAQKILRYELENKLEPLSKNERLLLAALNDLREGENSGKDLKLAQESVKQAEKAVAAEKKGKEEEAEKAEVSGAENVERVKRNQA